MDTDLNLLFSDKRTGKNSPTNSGDPRSEFQRDFDRIIFSSAFRRLQNKTQVFPLPGSVFVHNRLTHSLEVASVGRSLGSLIGDFIYREYKNELLEESIDFYRHSLYNVIASACLCHDIGNPAFGHSGEDAIATYFKKNESYLKPSFSQEEWEDLINFEGNANAIRVLTQQQKGKSDGGFKLTYSTLSAIIKYPCESTGKQKPILHRKKFGCFQSEKSTFIDIAKQTGMIEEQRSPIVYFRHPFVWLVEAADDICYNIIDFEDAHRLGIIEHSECIDLFTELVTCIGIDNKRKIDFVLNSIGDRNDKISYLRAKAIHALTMTARGIYEKHFPDFLKGNFKKSLIEIIKEDCSALEEIFSFSEQRIYNHRKVVEIENAGYNVMYELLSHFIPPILKTSDKRSQFEKKAIKLLPPAYNYDDQETYKKVMGVIDYVSGMTDNYATELYKRIKGIEIGMTV